MQLDPITTTGGHILSLCGWPIEIFVSNLKVQTKIGLSWWPTDQVTFFCYCWRIQLVYDYTAPSLECQYLHKSSFIVHLSISAAIFESWRLFQSSTIEQISLFGWHQESHPPTHASHPDNQDNGRAFVFRSFLSRNFDQFVALLFHGLIPNQMEIWNYLLPALALWMWVWYPLKWGFKAIQNGNEFQNSFAYCGPDFKCLLLLLPCSLTPCKWFLIAIVCYRSDWIVCLKLIWRRLSFVQ